MVSRVMPERTEPAGNQEGRATRDEARSVRVEHDPAAEALSGLVNRVKVEYQEMPGMRLTVSQAQRLFGINESVCRQVLEVLSNMGHLRVADGQYMRAPERRAGGSVPPDPPQAPRGDRGR